MSNQLIKPVTSHSWVIFIRQFVEKIATVSQKGNCATAESLHKPDIHRNSLIQGSYINISLC